MRWGSQNGLANIPLVLGLLLMAAMTPVVVRLSQQTTENRGRAAGETSCYGGVEDGGYACYGTCKKCVNGEFVDVGGAELGKCPKTCGGDSRMVVVVNAGTDKSCTTICSDWGGSCGSVGTDAGGTNGKYESYDTASRNCVEEGASCGISMRSQGRKCRDRVSRWTYCKCKKI